MKDQMVIYNEQQESAVGRNEYYNEKVIRRKGKKCLVKWEGYPDYKFLGPLWYNQECLIATQTTA